MEKKILPALYSIFLLCFMVVQVVVWQLSYDEEKREKKAMQAQVQSQKGNSTEPVIKL